MNRNLRERNTDIVFLENGVDNVIHLALHLPAAGLMASGRGGKHHAAVIQPVDADVDRSVQDKRTLAGHIIQFRLQDLLYGFQILFVADLELTVYDR